MKSPRALLAALIERFRHAVSRWRARRLLAQSLPTGRALLEAGQLRNDVQPLVRERAQAARIDVRLPALPPATQDLAVLRLRAFLLDGDARPPAMAEPMRLAVSRAPDPATIPRNRPEPPRIERGAARPEKLGLDDDGLPPAAREQPALSPERPQPPRPGHRLRPRMPLARAPIRYRLDWRAFRADPQRGTMANEQILPGPRRPPDTWILKPLHDAVVEVRYLEKRFFWPPPTDLEWFVHWLNERAERRAPGGKEPRERKQPHDIDWMIWEDNREQMLIRRDVPKDENPPVEPENWHVHARNPGIGGKPRIDFADYMKPTEWIEVSIAALRELKPRLPGNTVREPFRQRLAVLAALDER